MVYTCVLITCLSGWWTVSVYIYIFSHINVCTHMCGGVFFRSEECCDIHPNQSSQLQTCFSEYKVFHTGELSYYKSSARIFHNDAAICQQSTELVLCYLFY